MNKHRRREIARAEFLRDLPKVPADLIEAGIIAGAIGGDFDYSSISFQVEMMRGHGMREAHRLIATPIDLIVVPLRSPWAMPKFPVAIRAIYPQPGRQAKLARIGSMKSKFIAPIAGIFWRHYESDWNEFSSSATEENEVGPSPTDWNLLGSYENYWDNFGTKMILGPSPTDWISVGLLGQIWDKNGLKKVHFGSFRLTDHRLQPE
jgi:hypothetical protein